MLKYVELKEKPREFLSVTSLTNEEFQALLPTFERLYEMTAKPKPKPNKRKKQRAGGGGRKAKLADIADKLLFILAYQKTAPLQTWHGLQFGLSAWTSQLLGASSATCFADEFSGNGDETITKRRGSCRFN